MHTWKYNNFPAPTIKTFRLMQAISLWRDRWPKENFINNSIRFLRIHCKCLRISMHRMLRCTIIADQGNLTPMSTFCTLTHLRSCLWLSIRLRSPCACQSKEAYISAMTTSPRSSSTPTKRSQVCWPQSTNKTFNLPSWTIAFRPWCS